MTTKSKHLSFRLNRASYIDLFSKFFHRDALQKICNWVIIKDPIHLKRVTAQSCQMMMPIVKICVTKIGYEVTFSILKRLGNFCFPSLPLIWQWKNFENLLIFWRNWECITKVSGLLFLSTARYARPESIHSERLGYPSRRGAWCMGEVRDDRTPRS